MLLTKNVELLPQEFLIKTGPVDHADWNYKKGLLGKIMRKRFELCLALMETAKYNRVLEIGYGSGVFFPELSRRANNLYGIDIHKKPQAVREILNKHGIKASLHVASAEDLPFESGYFDAIVAISALEFVADLEKTCREIIRVMAPHASFYVVTPGVSPVLDFGFNLLTGKRAKEDFEDRREKIIPTLRAFFQVTKYLAFPGLGISAIDLYNAFELKHKM